MAGTVRERLRIQRQSAGVSPSVESLGLTDDRPHYDAHEAGGDRQWHAGPPAPGLARFLGQTGTSAEPETGRQSGQARGGPARELKLSQPDDPDEREADRVADRVARTAEHGRPGQGEADESSGPARPAVRSGGAGALRISRSVDSAAAASESSPGAGSRPGGMPLPQTTRSQLEPRFGHDFSRVKVHADSAADEAARAADARAFTVGHDIVFAAGQYQPETPAGQRLLAHELTHVVQHGEEGNTVSRWGGPEHREITQKAGTDILEDKMFLLFVTQASPGMDYKGRRIFGTLPGFAAAKYGPKVLDVALNIATLGNFGAFGGKVPQGPTKGEGPEHGEGGDYKLAESAAKPINVAMEDQHIDKAVTARRKAEAIRTAGQPVHKVGSAAAVEIDELAVACHIAEDRGSHREGAKDLGHDDPREKAGGWDTDNKSDNKEGYLLAIENTKRVFQEWVKKTSEGGR